MRATIVALSPAALTPSEDASFCTAPILVRFSAFSRAAAASAGGAEAAAAGEPVAAAAGHEPGGRLAAFVAEGAGDDIAESHHAVTTCYDPMMTIHSPHPYG